MTKLADALRTDPFARRLALLALGGLLIRVLYVVLVVADYPRTPTDRYYYHETANLLVEGRGYIDPFLYRFTGLIEPSAGHPPLWSFVLAVFSWFGASSWVAHQLVGCLVGTGSIVALGLLGRRVGGTQVGLVGAGLAAVSPKLIGADGSLMTETLYGLFILLALLAAMTLVQRPERRAAVILGAMLGLAAMARAEALIFLVVLAAPLAYLHRRRWGSALRMLGVTALACLVVVGPWTVRNWTTFGHPVLISLNDSTVLAGANCESVYEGSNLGGWDVRCLAPRQLELPEDEQHAIWRADGLEYLSEHLSDLPRVIPVRVLRSWDLYQPIRQTAAAEGRDVNLEKAGVWTFLLVVLPLAALGAFRLRRRPGVLLVLLSPAVAVTLSSAIGYGVPRFRHAADLTLLVLAAVAIVSLVELRAEGPRRRSEKPAAPTPAPTATPV